MIIVTAREEHESLLTQWIEIAESIRKGEKCNYGPMSLVSGSFRKLLLKCAKPDMESFLEPQLESLCHQNFKDFEVILVDRHADIRRDATDKYADRLNLVHVKDKPSPWHDMEVPEGWDADVDPAFPAVNNARNTGIILASGELVCFTDDNTLFEPKTLETAWKWKERGYGIKIVRNRFDILGVTGKEIQLYQEFKTDDLYKKIWTEGHSPYNYRGAWSHGFTVALEHLLEVNGWEEVLLDGALGAEDIDMGHRLNNLLTRPTGTCSIVIDRDAMIWEIGHPHFHHGRPPIKSNIEILNAVREYEKDLKANMRRPTEEELEKYRKHEEEHRFHPYWRTFPVEPFNLRELREKYRAGEFDWDK